MVRRQSAGDDEGLRERPEGPAGLEGASVVARSRCSGWVNTPNMLSLSRLPAAGLVWLAPGHWPLLLGTLVFAGVTDLLDGWSARHLRQGMLARGEDPGSLAAQGGAGAWLDPLCDKAYVISVLGSLWYALRPALNTILLVATRELLLVPLVLLYWGLPHLRSRLRYDFRASVWGKATTVLQFAAIGALMLRERLGFMVALAAAAVGTVAAMVYLVRALKTLRRHAGQS